MRFNPPTSWPAIPAGWTPPAGWMPDPSWPPAPAAWPFWLSDEGVPLPTTFAPGVPAWDPRAVVTSYGAPASAGSWPVAAPPLADDDTRNARRRAMVMFGIGVGVFLLGAGSAVAAGRSASGGWIWTGGMLVGVSLFIRALTQYRATKAAGPAKPASVAIVAIGLVLCAGAGVGALVSVVSPVKVPSEAGSCWTVADGDNIKSVPCSADHQYKVSQMVTDANSCPDYYVEMDNGKIGCLVDD